VWGRRKRGEGKGGEEEKEKGEKGRRRRKGVRWERGEGKLEKAIWGMGKWMGGRKVRVREFIKKCSRCKKKRYI